MDDFPAGPASLGPWRPPLALVIPVRNGGQDFERCLQRLQVSTWTDYELIVVDDGSTDGSGALAEAYGAFVVRHERALGPAAARNAGAKAASAPIVFFLDADVAVHPETLARVMRRFETDPTLTAIFGSYDDSPTAPGLVSRFRNLLHHFIHQQGTFQGDARPAHTFWTGCGAIRRRVFLEVGGFDPRLYRRPAIEDIELGYRLSRAGHRIALVRNIQVTHLKKWTLRQVIKTDIFQRGVPWMLLMLRSRVDETDLNVSCRQRACVLSTGFATLALLVSPLVPALIALTLLGLLLNVGLNGPFYRFLARRQGWGFALACVPLHAVYFGCCGLSVVIALAIWYGPKWDRAATVEGRVHSPTSATPSTPGPPHATPNRSRSRSRWVRH